MEEDPGEEPSKIDIIIVGAGLSGLVSAKKIKEKESSLHVRILEATDVIGGQIVNTTLGEVGGKWITTEQVHMKRLLDELDVPISNRSLLKPDYQRCWDIDRGVFAPLANYELRRYLQELELKVGLFKAGRMRSKKHSRRMRDHICNRLFFTQSRQFMFNVVLLISGLRAEEISFREFMCICYSCGGLQKMIDIYIDCPTTLLEISSAHLLKSLAARLEFTEIFFWRKVLTIRHFKDYVEILDSQNELHVADVVILAIPWNCVQDINISPPIPTDLYKLQVKALPRVTIATSFIAKYSRAFWRNMGYSGSFVNIDPPIFGHEYRDTIYSGVILHEQGLEPVVRSMALNSMAQHFGEQMLVPRTYFQHSFRLSAVHSEPFTAPWNRIVWASSAMAATCYRGFLSGAVQSGLRAAMNALLLLRPQTIGYQDIAELQCAKGPREQDISFTALWLSELNLYNVTYYSVLAVGVTTAVKQVYKRLN